MKKYIDLVKSVFKEGSINESRNGTTISCFGKQVTIDLSNGFPLLTTKYVHFKSIMYELLWFLKGETNIKYLNNNGVSIWDEWADELGNLGPIYGHQWRSWNGHKDQMVDTLNEMKVNPSSRRLIVSSWNADIIEDMAIPPCHCFFQFNIVNNILSCHVYQRSADLFLGVPFNIASYALLVHMVAHTLNMDVGKLIFSYGDIHIYENHIDQLNIQIKRKPLPLPNIIINKKFKTIFDIGYNDVMIKNYKHCEKLTGKVAI